MYNEWNLDALYKGVDDPKIQSDLARLEEVIALYKKTTAELDPAKPAESIRTALLVNEELSVLVRRLSTFFSLRRSANNNDSAGAAYMTRIQALAASVAKESVMFEKFVGAVEDLDAVIESDELLREYRFLLEETAKSVSHKMTDEEEALFARMNISGGRAWGDLMNYLTATVEVD